MSCHNTEHPVMTLPEAVYLSLLRVRDLWLLDLCQDLFVEGDVLRDLVEDLDESEEEEEQVDVRLLERRLE